MMIERFERIQLCCEDAASASDHYSQLLGRSPDWQGQYRLADSAGVTLDKGKSVWFMLSNTCIELFDNSRRVSKPGICGIVLEHVAGSITAARSIDAQPHHYSYNSTGSDGQDLHHKRLLLPSRDNENYQISLLADDAERVGSSDRAGDIPSVDHLVLRAGNYEKLVARYGESGLGLRLALDKHAPQWGGRMLFFRTGKMTLEAIVPDKTTSKPDLFWGIAYRTHNLSKCHSRLQDAGVQLSDIRQGRKPGTLVATVKSDDLGVPTLLVEQVDR